MNDDDGSRRGGEPSGTAAAAAASSSSTSTTSTTRRKPLVVKVKKRKNKKRLLLGQQHRGTAVGGGVRSKAGLPSSSCNVTRRTFTDKQNDGKGEDDDDDDVFDDGMDDLLGQATLCDTFLAMQSLLQAPPPPPPASAARTAAGTDVAAKAATETPPPQATFISIPLSNNSNTPKDMIGGILECQLYQHFAAQHTSGGDSIVTQELVDLFRTNQFRKLSAPHSSNSNTSRMPPLSILVLTRDYVAGVQDALLQQQQPANTAAATTSLATMAVDWFIRHFSDWTRERISLDELEQQWKQDDTPTTKRNVSALQSALQQLVDMQVLLPCRNAYESSISSDAAASYQLWLPSWGLVLKAWNKACQTLQTQIKQSHYKERSLSSLNQVYSPIPTHLVATWLESVGRVEIIQRPSGKFVRLAVHDA